LAKISRRKFVGNSVGVAIVSGLSHPIGAEQASTITVTELVCEKQYNPLGIDGVSPRLSWQSSTLVNTGENDARQAAYQVLVASTQELISRNIGNCWDSGKVLSSESVLISYAGTPLSSFGRYWWKVRLWDRAGRVSSWSAPAIFETAIIGNESWAAKWIEAPDSFLKQQSPEYHSSIPLGKWIWPEEQLRVYLRKFFDLQSDKHLTCALMEAYCDNEFHVFLNGQKVIFPEGNGEESSRMVEVTSLLKEKANFLGVQAYQSNDPCRFSAAFRCRLQLEFADGTKQYVVSDESWQSGVMGRFFQNADPKDWQNTSSIGTWNAIVTSVDIHPRLLRHSTYLRKEFLLHSSVRSARIYATARGFYDLRLNGKPVGRARLSPGCVHKLQYYQVHNVTDVLRKGSNTLAAMMGSGWLNSRSFGAMSAHKPQLLLYLRVELEDGSIFEGGTGPDWKLQFSPLIDNDLQWGERYDARKELPGWDTSGYDDKAWVNAAVAVPSEILPLRAQAFEDIEVADEYEAAYVTSLGDNTHLIDFGKNRAGRSRLVLKNTKAGQLVVIKYGERLDSDGLVQDDVYSDVYYPADNDWKTGKARFMTRNLDTYICRGAENEIYEPRFTYTGFRYGQISSWPGSIDKGTLTQIAFHTSYTKTGSFTCSDDLVSSISSGIELSMQNNHHSGPTDCPTREKNFWNGDANVFCETACWYGDVSRLYSTWTINGRKIPSDAVAWGDEVITLPWMMYMFYGDRRPAEQGYASMVKLIEGRLKRSENGLYTGKGETGHGDHISPEPMPLPAFNAAIHTQSLKRVAQLAQLLGKSDDAEHYNAAVTTAIKAFNQAFFANVGSLDIGASQSTAVLLLALDLLPSEQRTRVMETLMMELRKHDYHPTTGYVSTPYLLPLLTENGRVDDAWRMVTQKTKPSWGFMLESGSTMTEAWQAHTATVGSGLSMDHFALGSVGRWFFEYLGGIRPDFSRPAFQQLLLKPYMPTQLTSAKVRFNSVRGPIASEWEKTGDEIVWRVTVPSNTNADLHIPCTNPSTLKEGKAQSPVKYRAGDARDRIIVQTGPGKFIYRWHI
jgi:alpha-L-rhamnosidase